MNDTPVNPISADDRTSAMLAHLLGFFTSWLGPLIVYFIKKDKSDFAAFHALQALFFQIAIMVLSFSGFAVLHILGWGVITVLNIVFCLIAGLAANRGEWYEIPVIGEFARKQIH
ncbi:hypothetical protein CCAX7_12850 [Capsulimonas corticalis]|uniref:Uncharacterized protein n=1 Tax=Capsulimonas corticalis TaxID=2219043 RepID=A0A402D4V3_9BACT|nr:DUF4870 domain-containing protein [Capsulimonas corticalis]BDI29234.1 hypothetical protein CCAX7_12850 [Capsulimonas corticalis]